jgi:hypothetical protein
VHRGDTVHLVTTDEEKPIKLGFLNKLNHKKYFFANGFKKAATKNLL